MQENQKLPPLMIVIISSMRSNIIIKDGSG